jgi:hypothetical protein
MKNTQNMSKSTTQGMTINAPDQIARNTVETAKSFLLLGVQVDVPNYEKTSSNNISKVCLYSGNPESLSTQNFLASASVHVCRDHNDHFSVNTALMPVSQNQPYKWDACNEGDGCIANHFAQAYTMGLQSGVTVSRDTCPANQWVTVPDDGFLVGNVGGNSGITQILATVRRNDTEAELQLAGASQIYGVDVYLPWNSFCIPVFKGWQVKVNFTDHTGQGSTAGATASFDLFTFENHQVFEANYERIEVTTAYHAQNDIFLIGDVRTTQDKACLRMTGSTSDDGTNYTQIAGSSVYCGKNRWSQYSSFLMPVRKEQSFKTDISGSGNLEGRAYIVNVLPQN